MKARSSETNTNHPFVKRLSNALPIGDIQGLLINANGNFSCCVEYIEYEQPGENFREQFTLQEWRQKSIFSTIVGVPFYVIVGNLNKTYNVYNFFIDKKDNKLESRVFKENLDANMLVQQWGEWKGTKQIKALSEAALRIKQTRIDAVLEAAGLQWGGNIDGFILNKGSVGVLIEYRYPTRFILENYDPQKFFFGTANKAGDYGTWRPLIKLKEQLDAPLLLLCFEQPNRQACSIAEIVGMTRNQGLIYRNSRGPTTNVINELEKAIRQILNFVL